MNTFINVTIKINTIKHMQKYILIIAWRGNVPKPDFDSQPSVMVYESTKLPPLLTTV